MRHDELKAARILDVVSLGERPHYYVVELERRTGGYVASVAITTEGQPMGIEGPTPAPMPGSLDISVASQRTFNRTSQSPRNARYAYAPNSAEPGSSIYRPLVAVETAEGLVFFNSRGQAFQEGPQAETRRADAKLPGRGSRRNGLDLMPVPGW
jgi:hypothetical protein